MKRGEIWISTVIYIGLGVIAITILVGAGIPLINSMRDRNTFFQTKEVMHTIDRAIQDVVSEGPGSQRFLSPLEIKKGTLNIDTSGIIWKMDTKAVIQQPGAVIQEGNLELKLEEDSLIVDQYVASIKLPITLPGICIGGNPNCALIQVHDLRGRFSLVIINEGVSTLPPYLIMVNIKQT